MFSRRGTWPSLAGAVVRSREGSQVAQRLAQLEFVCEHAEILAAFATIS